MTVDQALSFALITGTIVLFIWGRIAYDLVAVLALLVGVAIGIIPADKAFSGFSDDIVVIVASALLVSAAVARSGAIESFMRPFLRYLTSPAAQVPALAGAVMLLSVFAKNIGALAIFMPVAFQLARRTGTSPSLLLMPMSFASLIGGLATLVGTSPNIIVAKVRADLVGQPFGMFDYTPVGLSIALCGFVFLSFGYRLLPKRKPPASIDAAFNLGGYTTEARLSADSPLAGQSVADLEAAAENEVKVLVIIRERFRRYVPTPQSRLQGGDVVLLEGEPENLERAVARTRLELVGEKGGGDVSEQDQAVVEGVVTADSPLVNRTAARLNLRGRHGVSLLAVSRSGENVGQRLHAVRFRAGDVVVLKGVSEAMPQTLGDLRILPLAERAITLGRSRRSYIPILVLAAAILLVAFHVAPVSIAFFGAAAVLLLLRVMTMHEAYATIEWPVIVLLGALIPVSETVRTTGATDLIAGWLQSAVQYLPPTGALGLMIIIGMAVTPFLNNAATVLMIAPIAANLATRLNLNPDPFLMAVALGAACDFLTPIGHQCNTLVMGPGGYRFGDYWRLGFPLSILVVVLGVPLIAFFWPLVK